MRFHRTIKFQLTVWYVLILATVVVFFGLITYLLLARDIYPSQAGSTHVAVFKVQALPTNLSSRSVPAVQPGSYQPIAGYGISQERLDQLKSGPATPFEIIRPEGLLSVDQRAFFTPEMQGPLDVRLYYRPIEAEPGFFDVLVVTQSKSGLVDVLLAYREALFVAMPVTLALAGVLGYFLIWRMLRPIETFGRLAAEIPVGTPGQGIQMNSHAVEVENLSRAVNHTFGRLQTAVERERQFSRDVSHELRAPLAIMQSEASLALTRARSAGEYQAHLEEISKEISHMSSVVGKLRFLARVDAGQEKLTSGPVNLREVLSDVTMATRTFAEGKGLSLSLDSLEDVTVSGDETRLRELFLNLVDNAIKYTPSGGAITLSLARQDGRAFASVHDTGIGVADEHLTHIFERFYRVNQDTDSDNSTGLGLAISTEIVKLHGGAISAQSQLGKGSTFTVVLPVSL